MNSYKLRDDQVGGGLKVTPTEREDYRRAKVVVDSVVNGASGKPIPILGRMSGFVPFNLPIVLALLVAPPTTRNIVLAQGVNQTYNSLMNYSNKSDGAAYTNYDILQGYASAVALSIAISLGGQRMFAPWIAKFKAPGA